MGEMTATDFEGFPPLLAEKRIAAATAVVHLKVVMCLCMFSVWLSVKAIFNFLDGEKVLKEKKKWGWIYGDCMWPPWGGERPIVEKGSRRVLLATVYIYTYFISYIYGCFVYSWRTPTVIPLGLNKLSLFGTKMVTLFGRWNKRLLFGKSLSGGQTLLAMWTTWTTIYGSFALSSSPPFIWFPPLLWKMSVVQVKHMGSWQLFLFRAVWFKPEWEISPTHRPT